MPRKKLNHTALDCLEDLGLLQRFSVIPIKGKRPFEKGWQKYCHEKRVFSKDHFFDADGTELNVGICCGPASGIIVLDVDDVTKFEEARKSKRWSLPDTFAVETGGGGLHYYFAYPREGGRLGNRTFKQFGFDIRGTGGQVVAPGSVHPDRAKGTSPLIGNKSLNLPNGCLHWPSRRLHILARKTERQGLTKIPKTKGLLSASERSSSSESFGQGIGRIMNPKVKLTLPCVGNWQNSLEATKMQWIGFFANLVFTGGNGTSHILPTGRLMEK